MSAVGTRVFGHRLLQVVAASVLGLDRTWKPSRSCIEAVKDSRNGEAQKSDISNLGIESESVLGFA